MLARAFFDPPRHAGDGGDSAIDRAWLEQRVCWHQQCLMNSPNTTVEDLRHERRLRPEAGFALAGSGRSLGRGRRIRGFGSSGMRGRGALPGGVWRPGGHGPLAARP